MENGKSDFLQRNPFQPLESKLWAMLVVLGFVAVFQVLVLILSVVVIFSDASYQRYIGAQIDKISDTVNENQTLIEQNQSLIKNKI